jgi:hypothetical protein
MINIQTRARNILLQPAQEWSVIAGESTDMATLLREYAAPLSAIPAVCAWIGFNVLGLSLYRTGIGAYGMGAVGAGFVSGAVNAIITWVFGLVGAWLAAIVIEQLAPTFASRGSTAQALKLVVYASTPVWIAGVLNLLPPLAPLTIIAALYAIYLFYLGLPVVMHTPGDKVVPYMLVSAIVVIVVNVVVFTIAGMLRVIA